MCVFRNWNYNTYYYVWILCVEHIRVGGNDNIIFVFTNFCWSMYYNYSAITTKKLKLGRELHLSPVYQVKGLHNSSSLYKITHYCTLGRVWQHLRKGYKQDAKLPFDTLAQLEEQQIFNLWVMGSSPICITKQAR